MKKKVYAYVHTHWDREWYREFEEFRVRLLDVFDDVLNKLQTNELETFYFDGQTAAVEDYLEIKPQKETVIKDLIEAKRLFIGPYYCSTDSFLVDSESIIKNLQIGIEYSKKFGCNDFIAYHADTFGHSSYIPQIIKYFNIPYAIFWRGLGELESEFLFRKLKSTYLIQGYYHDYLCQPLCYRDKINMLRNTLDKIAAYSSENILLPLGADHMAVANNIKTQLNYINNILKDYEIILSTPFEYFNKVKKNFRRNLTCEFRDSKRNFILPGVYSSRIDLKQSNAKNQWNLSRLVQPFQAIFSFLSLSKSYQQEVDYIYKLLIKNHAHDSIYGCSVDNVHKENLMRYLKVQEASNAVVKSVQRDSGKKTYKLYAVNLSNYTLNGAIRVTGNKNLRRQFKSQMLYPKKGFSLQNMYDIYTAPVTEEYRTYYECLIDLKDIKPFSITEITDKHLNKVNTLKITNTSIENDKIGLFVKNDKVLLKDKTKNKVYEDFITFINRADIGDSYNFGALENDKPLYSKLIETKIKQKGHIQCVLQLKFELSIPVRAKNRRNERVKRKHIITMNVILQNQNDFLEFNLDWENKSVDHILQLEFSMDKPVNYTESDDLAGYTTREFDPDYDIYSHLPAPRGGELKYNTAPFQKLLFVQGVGIITEGLQEYEVYQNNLRLTLLRSTGVISNPKNPTRGTPAGPPLRVPDLQLLGQRSARFAITFKDNIQDCEPEVEKFYQTVLSVKTNIKDLVLFETGNSNILVNTIKTNDTGDLIIRFLNKSNKKQKLKFRTQIYNNGIFYTNAMEEIDSPYQDGFVEANSFVTVLIKADKDLFIFLS